MIRGFYTAVSGLITLENEQQTVTNNIVNVNNNGYKKNTLTKQSFEDVMITNRQNKVGNRHIPNKLGNLNLGVKVNDVSTIYTQGAFKSTDSNTDFGIDGRGFFTVQRGNERLFTRSGDFKIDQQGYLITGNGDYVLGRNNATGAEEPIYVGKDEFSLDGNNNLQSAAGESTHTLLTADFTEYAPLEKVGDNYYKGDNPVYNAVVNVRQGVLETSNVNPTEELVKLMEIKRQFETNQKFVSMQDETVQKAANEIGSVR
ncbi:flagellar basal body rod protein FlgG [Clostridium botulinum]|uniref:Flagellar hook-basal body complex protein n=1 Tax=Clostridium botulinum (strain Eklund 17B / Type B) TaxID=935198 RepID=B2TLX1_CLOBB|nr:MULTISPECIES: flagellar basal-body rod protein FlgG [Clostridium]ACD22016.1 flagellar hook-basal body complex protein [Clostridium botulinum B str. Eklund 17B (NRP)]AIY81197.1 flagellar hook-basal body family protein [Clostridium botulinum 202F]KAI3348255.1 flagellar basal body rod protein FlgG [Clostridium botulinum]KFX57941.1 flagellar basal body rod protein FlgG [Clostridium botulinum]KFX58831.1 flagellar basal body rod protein FlgG [Clostridium botulinum]